jgi:hypothetical protein
MSDHLYRFEYRRVANGMDDWDNPSINYRVVLELRKFEIVKKTEKGCWIRSFPFSQTMPRKFVLNKARKRYAYPTVEEARLSFLARKKRYLGFLEIYKDVTRRAITLAENYKEESS